MNRSLRLGTLRWAQVHATRYLIVLLATALISCSDQAQAKTVSGYAHVIDGDTLEVAGQRVRLFGIDAPERSQSCSEDGQEWPCGETASAQLEKMIGGISISCSGTELDVYGRLLAVCYIGSTDLNGALVGSGWAMAFRKYSDKYVANEARAQAAKSGLWSSKFKRPEDFRAEQSDHSALRAPQPLARPLSSRPAASTCLIKGNHSRRGDWIYHLPGMPYYNQTRAEAMFCSEAEAQAAGYRRAIVR